MYLVSVGKRNSNCCFHSTAINVAIATVLALLAIGCFIALSHSDYSEATTSGKCGPDATWELDSQGNLTISGVGWMYDYSTGTHPSWDTYNVRTVTINGVNSIGEYTFYNCSFLTTVTIGNSVANIKDHAFDGCRSLTTFEVDTYNYNFCA